MPTEYNLVLVMFLANVAGMLLVAGAIYGAIRADLRYIHEKIATLDGVHKDRLEAAEGSIHRRIDDLRGSSNDHP